MNENVRKKAPSSVRRVLVTLAKTLVTAGVIVFVIHKFGLRELLRQLLNANGWWLLCAMAAFGLSGMIGAVQWRMLLRHKGVTIPYATASGLYFMGMFFNNFMFGTATADTLRITYIKMGRQSGSAGFGATFLDRFAGLWAMMGFAIAGSGVLLHRGLLHDRTLSTALLALGVTFCLFCAILAFLVSSRLQRLSFVVLDLLPLPQTGKEKIRNAVSQAVLEAKDVTLMVRVSLLSLGIQVLRILVHICCAAALGVLTGANWHYFFIFVPIVAMLMTFPFPFGIKESVGGTLFALAGFTPSTAWVMEMLASIVGLMAAFPGGIFFITHRPKKDSRGESA
jgi:hypothetical protein